MKFELTTDRLELKVLNTDSAPLILDFYKRNADIIEQYEPIIGEDFYTLNHQKALLDFEYKNILKLAVIRYWIFEKDHPDKIIGTISYRNIVRPIYSCCTIGYKMDRDYMNKGYCTEAIKNTIPIITDDIGIHRIEAFVLPDNYASIHLLNKLGFEKEGYIRDKIMIKDKRMDHLLLSYIANN